jgi:protein-L-isoaspartate(D-aspartate) O-methyltransferase
MDHAAARLEMVEQQIVPRGVRCPAVLDAMRTVPRHLFIPPDNQDLAYRDGPVGIGRGQTISQPYLVAYMSEKLQLLPGMRVLEVGTGSGYQTAVLVHLGAKVHSVEILDTLAKRAADRLHQTGYGAAHLQTSDGINGWETDIPFDRIIVTASPAAVPTALVGQLRVGGQMLIPVGQRARQQLLRITRTSTSWKEESLIPVLFVPMTGEISDSR